ncbi:globin-coupled sensor protein [Halalkalibacillus halophilus]|uniref:globin-coupled sensor protein n=1 Tax=Halalkalibacillus halophilus TaxID=392827 RepID=UPI00041FCE65|nr:globin-coupled sensor protein [Halalkalibacillus halophilus]
MFNKKKKEATKAFDANEWLSEVTLDIPPASDLEKQLHMIHLTKKDLAVLIAIKPLVSKHIESIVDQFYKNIEHEPSLMEMIKRNSSIERLKQTLTVHIQEMFNGSINESFVEQRKRIAYAHVRIGLAPKWYLCAFQDLLNSFQSIFFEEIKSKEECLTALHATSKILNIEQQLVLETFEQENTRIREEQNEKQATLLEEMENMSSELVQISNQTDASLQQLLGYAEEIKTFSASTTESASTVEQQSTTGKTSLEGEVEKMATVEAEMSKIYEDMTKLEEASGQINEILSFITDVSEQTNLLSLNASIEAARAGDLGQGFAVVAQEVKKLADQTKGSIENISGLIHTTNTQINRVSKDITATSKLIIDGTESMRNTNTFFDDILVHTHESKSMNDEMDQRIQAFNGIITQITESFAEVNEAAESLAATAKEHH